MNIIFTKLNENWNAYPNGSDSFVKVNDENIEFRFKLNSLIYDHINDVDFGILLFKNCSLYRLGSTNDEGFYLGQCRFSKYCPKWGEFYEVEGDGKLLNQPMDWVKVEGSGKRHFLFYLRDETFECKAQDWAFEYENC